MKRLLFFVACIPLVVGCGHPANSFHSYPPGYPGKSAEEGVTVRLPAASVNGFLGELRKESARLEGASLQATLWTGARGASASANADVYSAAMRDAQLKAQRMAAFIHTSLGGATAVSEILGSSSGQPESAANFGPQPEAVTIEKRALIRVGSHGPVVLAVRYRLASGGTISVFGLSDALAHGEAQGVRINFQIRGANGAQLNRRIDRYLQMLRRVAKRKGISESAIAVTAVQVN